MLEHNSLSHLQAYFAMFGNLMNFDAAISFLSHSNWGFIALWIVLLGGAFGACFSENLTQHVNRGRSRRPHR